jgi:hypothetical protein
MNQGFVSARARRGERTRDLVAKMSGGSPTVDTAALLGERLSTLQAERDAAIGSGNDDAAAFAEHKLDQLFGDVRSAGAAGEEGAEQSPAPSFDGGVQRRVFPARHTQETTGQLLARSIAQSRVERAERGRPTIVPAAE